MGKGSARHCQVRTVESNESEPLMKCRKFQEVVKIGVYSVLREECGRNLFTAHMATGIKAARTRSRLFCGTWEPVTPMQRERCKWEKNKYLSTCAMIAPFPWTVV